MKEKGLKIVELVRSGLSYREVAKKVGLKSTNSINHYMRRFNGKRIYLTELERNTLKKVILDLRNFQDDADTFRITSSILLNL